MMICMQPENYNFIFYGNAMVFYVWITRLEVCQEYDEQRPSEGSFKAGVDTGF